MQYCHCCKYYIYETKLKTHCDNQLEIAEKNIVIFQILL